MELIIKQLKKTQPGHFPKHYMSGKSKRLQLNQAELLYMMAFLQYFL